MEKELKDKAEKYLREKVYEMGYPVYQAHDDTGESLQGHYEIVSRVMSDFTLEIIKEKDDKIKKEFDANFEMSADIERQREEIQTLKEEMLKDIEFLESYLPENSSKIYGYFKPKNLDVDHEAGAEWMLKVILTKLKDKWKKN